VSWLESIDLSSLVDTDRVVSLVLAVVTVLAGLVVARVVARMLGRLAARRFGRQETMLVRRLTFWGLAGLAMIAALEQLGFDLTVLLGAAGVLTVAIGFASQTSASNLISGLFLMAERPFVAGDYIRVGEVVGEVLSIDLLAVKLRLFDNSTVRLPNENLIKDQLTNLTPFPIRRIDLQIGIAYKEDVRRVLEVLEGVAERNPECLDEPAPQFYFDAFGDSALELRFCVWASVETFIPLKTELMTQIKEAFDAAGVEIPFPHRTLYTGSVTEPFPVRVIDGDATQQE
jgi:small-conductance mechanosensitive channel